MTIIDKKTNTSYPYLTVRQAAEIIGVSRSTIYRWQKARMMESYHHFEVYFMELEYFSKPVFV